MDRVQVRLPAENRPLLLEQLFPGADYSVIACDRRNCAAVMAPAAAREAVLNTLALAACVFVVWSVVETVLSIVD